MKFKSIDPPRSFQVGEHKIEIKDCARIELKPSEQVTFVTEAGAEYDVARKEWGFYATPSLNGRLKQFHLKAALVKNKVTKKFYIFLVEEGKEKECERYLDSERLDIVSWLHDDGVLEQVEVKLKGKTG